MWCSYWDRFQVQVSVTVFPSLSLFLSTATPLLFCSFFFVSFFLFFSSTAQHVRVVRDSAGLFQSCVRSFSVLRCCCPPPRKFRTPAKPTVKPIPLAKHRQIAKETQRLLVAMKIRRPPRTFYKGLVVQPQGTLAVFVDLYVPCHVHCVVRCSVQSAGQHGSTQTNRQQPFLHVVEHHTDARLCTKLACCSAPLFMRFVLVWLFKCVCM